MGNNTYDNGVQLELNCSSEGGPDLEYSWSRTNIFSATTTTNTSTLTISDLATVDGGEYTCTVTNDAETETMTVTVYGGFFFLFVFYILFSRLIIHFQLDNIIGFVDSCKLIIIP